jgi:hypothetical protein
MKITIISHDRWGYNNQIISNLNSKGHVVNHIDFTNFDYTYPNYLFRIYNFFLKLFLKKNLKHIHHGKEIIKQLKQIGEKQDSILTIKGDWIDPDSIAEFKKYSNKSIAFFNDNIQRCPKILRTIAQFDTVYSFEKEDCKRHNLNFITNWINSDTENCAITENHKYTVFNISSIDNRIDTILKIAKELELKKMSFKIIVVDKKMGSNSNTSIEFIPQRLLISEVKKYIDQSKLLLDIHHEKQIGLTFRVFESIERNKKLITTNPDIVNYDFYNPNNILVIDANKPEIPISFIETNYEEIPSSIYKKYTINNWVDTVFELKNC